MRSPCSPSRESRLRCQPFHPITSERVLARWNDHFSLWLLRITNPRRIPMANEKNLQELFHDTLKDIYFAEKKILSALPKMAKAAQAPELKEAFEKHEAETEE